MNEDGSQGLEGECLEVRRVRAQELDERVARAANAGKQLSTAKETRRGEISEWRMRRRTVIDHTVVSASGLDSTGFHLSSSSSAISAIVILFYLTFK